MAIKRARRVIFPKLPKLSSRALSLVRRQTRLGKTKPVDPRVLRFLALSSQGKSAYLSLRLWKSHMGQNMISAVFETRPDRGLRVYSEGLLQPTVGDGDRETCYP